MVSNVKALFLLLASHRINKLLLPLILKTHFVGKCFLLMVAVFKNILHVCIVFEIKEAFHRKHTPTRLVINSLVLISIHRGAVE